MLFVYSNAPNQRFFVFTMKRLTRRNRSASREQNDRTTGSPSCLPGSILCGGLPPSSPLAVEAVPVASSSLQKSIEVDEIKHIDCGALEDAEQRAKYGVTCGAALLGGNGLQHYDRFIATLLRERSLVKDGIAPTAAVKPKPQVNKPRSLTTRLRKRRTVTDRVDDKPSVNGTSNGDFREEAETKTIGLRKPVEDASLLMKSEGPEFLSAASINGGMSICETKVNGCRSAMEVMETDLTRGTPMNHGTTERSARQRRWRRRRNDHQSDDLNGSYTAQCRTDGCDIAASNARVHANYQRSQIGATTAVHDNSRTEISTHTDKAVSDRHQCGSDYLRESCAFRDGFDGRDIAALRARNRLQSLRSAAAVSKDCQPGIPTRTDEVVVDRPQDGGNLEEIFTADDRSEGYDTEASHAACRVEYELSKIKTYTIFNDSEPGLSTYVDKAEVNRRNEKGVFGLNVGVQFIDCDDQRIEPTNKDELQTKQPIRLSQVDRTRNRPTSLTSDRRKKFGNELTASSPSLRDSGRRVTGACRRGNLHACRCTVGRRSSSQCGECNRPLSLGRECRSQPSLAYSRADQASSEFGRLTGDNTHRSQLLETCRCSIAWPTTTAQPCVKKTENTDDYVRQSPQPTHDLLQSDNNVANINSTSPELGKHLSYDVQHHSADQRQQPSDPFVNLPSNNIPRLIPPKSCENSRHLPTVNRRSVQLTSFPGRERQNGGRGGKSSKCLLKVEFILTRLQTEDQNTTLVFAHKGVADQVLAGDVPNLPLSHGSTCSTSDVMLTVMGDDNDDAVNDNKGNLARNCTVVKSLTVSQPTASVLATSGDLMYSPVDSVHWATDSGTVGDVMPCKVASGDVDDMSQSLMLYEFAEVTSIFHNFANDLLPTTDRELSLVPYETARRQADRSSTMALVRQARPGITYSGAVVPYGTLSPVCVPLPLMTWTWNHDDFTGSRRQPTKDDVTHIQYVSACRTVDIKPLIDHFTLVTPSSRDFFHC